VGGFRSGLPLSVAAGALAISFGAVATAEGLPALSVVAMSALAFGGSAQFAALAVVASGGGLAAAAGASLLMSARYLPLGFVIAPALSGGPLRRGLEAQAIVDGTWSTARGPDGVYDRGLLLASSLPQYVAWVGGTAVGVVAGDAVGDLDRFGVDAIFPAFFLALIVKEGARRGRAPVAFGAGLLALCLVPIAPAGTPVLAAGALALLAAWWWERSR
jgi:predicted branched-subunit amino acid permease